MRQRYCHFGGSYLVPYCIPKGLCLFKIPSEMNAFNTFFLKKKKNQKH